MSWKGMQETSNMKDERTGCNPGVFLSGRRFLKFQGFPGSSGIGVICVVDLFLILVNGSR